MRPMQAAILLGVLAGLAGLVWWITTLGSAGPRVAGPARFLDVPGATVHADGSQLDSVAPLEPADAEPDSGSAGRSLVEASDPRAHEAGTAAPAGGLSGRVIDSFGRPVAEATVYAARAGGGIPLPLDALDPAAMPWVRRVEAKTGADGRFSFPKSPVSFSEDSDETVRLAVRAPGFAPLRVERNVTEESAGDIGDLALEQSVVLSGRVLDTPGRAVLGAELHALAAAEQGPWLELAAGDGTRLASSDEAGAFRIDELAAGPYRVRVRHPEHPDGLLEGTTAVPGEVQSGLVITLADGHRIAGRVTGLAAEEAPSLRVRAEPTSTPVAGSRSASIESDGTFLLRGLAAGPDYVLRVVEVEDGNPFGNQRSASVSAKAGDVGVQIPLLAALAVRGEVVDAQTGAPIPRFEVEAGALWLVPLHGAEDEQHPDGRFRYEGVQAPPDAKIISVRVRAEGYAALELADLEIPASREVDLGVVRLEPAPELTVHVVDAASGAPVEGAQVSLCEIEGRDRSFDLPALIEHGSGARRTDAAGTVRLPSLPGGRGVLSVRHPDHSDFASDPFELPSVGGIERVVRLQAGGNVEVLVLTSAGEPAPGVAVQHQFLEALAPDVTELAFGAQQRTGADGRLVFLHLQAGAHAFRVAASQSGGLDFLGGRTIGRGAGERELPAEWVKVPVAEGQAQAITLRVAPRGSLHGRVSEAGRPLPGAALGLEDRSVPGDGRETHFFPGLDGRQVQSDGRGGYRFDDVEAGEYELVITHAARAMPARFPVRIEAGENELDLALSVTAIEGRITDAAGRPLAGVQVSARPAEERGAGGGVSGVRYQQILGDGGGIRFATGGGAAEAAKSDADGRYLLRGVQAEVPLAVEANLEDHCPARSGPVQVALDQTKSGIDLELRRGGRIDVRVLQADGAPASFCLVSAEFLGEAELPVGGRREFVPEGGAVSLRGLEPGPWSVSVTSMSPARPENPGAKAEPARVEVVAEEVRELELRLP